MSNQMSNKTNIIMLAFLIYFLTTVDNTLIVMAYFRSRLQNENSLMLVKLVFTKYYLQRRQLPKP
jgi:hypothetical protein